MQDYRLIDSTKRGYPKICTVLYRDSVDKGTRRLATVPQTDRASAFVVDLVKIFLTSTLITMQTAVVSRTVCMPVGGTKQFGRRLGR